MILLTRFLWHLRGMERCKLYFMLGLPTEDLEDVKGIAS